MDVGSDLALVLLFFAFVVKGLPREERAHAAWIGGSVLASVPETDGIWITKDEFFDQGAGIINR